jgi:hypothetical protein
MGKTFREWWIEERWLLPPSVQELLPGEHDLLKLAVRRA